MVPLTSTQINEFRHATVRDGLMNSTVGDYLNQKGKYQETYNFFRSIKDNICNDRHGRIFNTMAMIYDDAHKNNFNNIQNVDVSPVTVWWDDMAHMMTPQYEDMIGEFVDYLGQWSETESDSEYSDCSMVDETVFLETDVMDVMFDFIIEYVVKRMDTRIKLGSKRSTSYR